MMYFFPYYVVAARGRKLYCTSTPIDAGECTTYHIQFFSFHVFGGNDVLTLEKKGIFPFKKSSDKEKHKVENTNTKYQEKERFLDLKKCFLHNFLNYALRHILLVHF